MVTVPIYNQAGAAEGNYELSDAIFGIAPKKSVIHQVYRALEANARQPWADTKDRGEVRGGGRKVQRTRRRLRYQKEQAERATDQHGRPFGRAAV